jgi:hypothetical protein
MTRIHRSLIRRARKIDAGKIANDAEDYLYGFCAYKSYLDGVSGLNDVVKIKDSIKKIDYLEKEAIKLENQIDRLMERRALEAARLENMLLNNFEVLKEYLEPDELKDFGI